MKYRILSDKVGTPGDIYEPEIWVNIGVLIAGGFIEPINAPETEKPARKAASKKAEK